MAIRAGRLRDRVTFRERDPDAKDPETGQPYPPNHPGAWRDVVTVWAEVRDLAGRKFYEAQAAEAQVTTEIRIRYRAGIRPDMRVRCGDREWEIRAVQRPENRRTELLIMCEELGAGT